MLEPISTNPATSESPEARTSGNPILTVKTVKPLGKPCGR